MPFSVHHSATYDQGKDDKYIKMDRVIIYVILLCVLKI